MGDVRMARDGDDQLRADGGDLHQPDAVRGVLHRTLEESEGELVADLATECIEGLELRLAFEAWADAR